MKSHQHDSITIFASPYRCDKTSSTQKLIVPLYTISGSPTMLDLIANQLEIITQLSLAALIKDNDTILTLNETVLSTLQDGEQINYILARDGNQLFIYLFYT